MMCSICEFTLSFATEEDAIALMNIHTLAFTASNDAQFRAMFPIGMSVDDINTFSAAGILTPVQGPTRRTIKIVDGSTATPLAFASWTVPESWSRQHPIIPCKAAASDTDPVGVRAKTEGRDGGGSTVPQGINFSLLQALDARGRAWTKKYVDASKDFKLSLCFTHPSYQRQGLASRLLSFVTEQAKAADRGGAKIFLSSSPYAKAVYERNGWRALEESVLDLGAFGGTGKYVTSWMVKECF